MRSPAEEPLRIRNVAHKATNSHLHPSMVAKRIDLRPRYFPQCSTWNTIRAYEQCCEVCLGGCSIHYGPALQSSACGLLRHSQAEPMRWGPGQIWFGLGATRHRGGGSLMFQVGIIVLWAGDHRRHLCRERNRSFSESESANSEPTSLTGPAPGSAIMFHVEHS